MLIKLELSKKELEYIQISLDQYGQSILTKAIEMNRKGEEATPELMAHTLEGHIIHTKILNLLKGVK